MGVMDPCKLPPEIPHGSKDPSGLDNSSDFPLYVFPPWALQLHRAECSQHKMWTTRGCAHTEALVALALAVSPKLWLCPPPASHQGHQHGRTQTAGTGTSSFICIITRDTAGFRELAVWLKVDWGLKFRWIRDPRHSSRCVLGVLGAAPTESLNTLGWRDLL